MIGLRVLKRLGPKLRAQRERLYRTRQHMGANAGQPPSYPPEESAEGADSSAAFAPQQLGSPCLQDLLQACGPLPQRTLMMGACEDGLPFLLDLTNPAPGALLISADAGSGQEFLLRALLDSLVMLNQAEQASFYLISPQPQAFTGPCASQNCAGSSTPFETNAATFIARLWETCETRRRTGVDGPVLLLAIQDLADLLSSLDRESRTRLNNLLHHGPRTQIWVVATLDSEGLETVDERLLSAFRTRLLGYCGDSQVSSYLAGTALDTSSLQAGYQFCAPFGDEWISFWLCESI